MTGEPIVLSRKSHVALENVERVVGVFKAVVAQCRDIEYGATTETYILLWADTMISRPPDKKVEVDRTATRKHTCPIVNMRITPRGWQAAVREILTRSIFHKCTAIDHVSWLFSYQRDRRRCSDMCIVDNRSKENPTFLL